MSCQNRFNFIFGIENVQKIIWHDGCISISQIAKFFIKIDYKGELSMYDKSRRNKFSPG